jgi:hypothetical protein
MNGLERRKIAKRTAARRRLLGSRPFDEIPSLTTHSRNSQERRRNGGSVVIRAFILAVEQIFQLRQQITGPPILFRSFERIHGWSIIFSECVYEL